MSLGNDGDLGNGVRVALGPEDHLEIVSPNFDLGWRTSRGQVPGSAVLWQEASYEVVAKSPVGEDGFCWTLRRWKPTAVMRTVSTLDREFVSEVARRSKSEKRGLRARAWSVLLLPLLGALPARVQKKWANEWNFAAEGATQVSAISSLLVGGFGLIQALAFYFGSDWFLPWWPRWAIFVGPYLCCEGMARLALVGGDGEPVGSVFGLPALLFVPEPSPAAEPTEPRVRLFDESNGLLEVESPIHRSDWDGNGLMAYRGQSFLLQNTLREGRAWVYVFSRVQSPGEVETNLRLRPPGERSFGGPQKPTDSPSMIRITVVSAFMALAPREDQEVWGRHLEVSPVWFTALGAGVELIGGVINLTRDQVAVPPLLDLINWYLLGEGLVRFGSAIIGRPMGSIIGPVLRPLYRRWLSG